jgi:hypothetical protein
MFINDDRLKHAHAASQRHREQIAAISAGETAPWNPRSAAID